jgi:hypothetical protein
MNCLMSETSRGMMGNVLRSERIAGQLGVLFVRFRSRRNLVCGVALSLENGPSAQRID